MDLTKFITDWVPPIGIVAAGLFAFWRWGLSEWLRRQREIPSIDKGGMIAKGFPIDESKVWVQLDITWRNPGIVPFEVDTDLTKVDVFEIPDNLPVGPLKIRKGEITDLYEPRYSHKLFSGSRSLKFEPGTESVIQCHFILPTQQIILFRWKLFRKNPENRKLSRTRFLLFNPQALTTSDVPDFQETGTIEVEEDLGGT
jgi:hypothetical protein